MLVIGVTGPIASGKTTVDRILADCGAAPVIDADRVVHSILAGQSTQSAMIINAIVNRFGPDVLSAGSQREINRAALARHVFGYPSALADLEALTHPGVRAEIEAQLASAPLTATAVIDAVKLLPGSLARHCTARWWVFAQENQQRDRLIRERGMTPAAAALRLSAQQRLDDWRDQIDLVIDNSGTLAHTRQQVEDAWHALHRQQAGHE